MKSFDEIYRKIYSESNQELQKIKKANEKVDIKRFSTIIITILLLSLLSVIARYVIKNSNNEILIISSIVLLPFIILLALFPMIKVYLSTSKQDYKTVFKEKVVKELVTNMDNDFEYDLNTGKDPVGLYNAYNKSGFEAYHNYDAEDYVEGILDGKYPIRMAEVHTENESTDSEGHTHRYTVFHGIFGYIKCSKSITTTLKIRSDKGILGNLFAGKTKLEMDSPEFEKYFDINTGNKIVAMQILTHDVMELMVEYFKEYQIMYELTIRENQIYMRFHTGEVFEPKMNKDALDYNMLKEYYGILEFIFRLSRAINKAIENTEV